MSQHTPGPWKIDLDSEDMTGPTTANCHGPTVAGDRWPCRSVMAGHDTVAICPAQPNRESEKLLRDPSPGSDMANARLIAAAPDMLAALVPIRDYARDSPTGRMLTGEGYGMADAAITKATAEE